MIKTIAIIIVVLGVVIGGYAVAPKPPIPTLEEIFGTSDNSFEDLPNTVKEAGLYKIDMGKWNEVEIKDQDMPEVKLRKWDDETYIKISYPDFHPVSPKQDKGKLKWDNADKEVHLYPLEPREFEENGRTVKQLQNGGFEFEAAHEKRPI